MRGSGLVQRQSHRHRIHARTSAIRAGPSSGQQFCPEHNTRRTLDPRTARAHGHARAICAGRPLRLGRPRRHLGALASRSPAASSSPSRPRRPGRGGQSRRVLPGRLPGSRRDVCARCACEIEPKGCYRPYSGRARVAPLLVSVNLTVPQSRSHPSRLDSTQSTCVHRQHEHAMSRPAWSAV